jgi:hypothetical protein
LALILAKYFSWSPQTLYCKALAEIILKSNFENVVSKSFFVPACPG